MSIMPLNYNGLDLLKAMMPSWLSASSACVRGSQVVVVDNGSDDDSRQWCELQCPEVGWIQMTENRVLCAYNDAVKRVLSDYVLIINNDVELPENLLPVLIRRLESCDEAFGVMPRIVGENGEADVSTRLGAHFFHGHLGHKPLGSEAGGTLYLHGAAMLLRRERFLAIGGFDPLFFYQEDNDISYRAWRKGWSCWFEPGVVVRHLGSQTTEREYKRLVDRRALKEKANAIFVLKNIQNRLWLLNFAMWTMLKLIKMVVTFDRQRAWAMTQVIYRLPKILAGRSVQQRLPDLDLLNRVKACVPVEKN